MRSITAVEIGADTCALASTAVRGTEQYVNAADTLDPAAFPGIGGFAAALQQIRRSLKLPRRCRAVVWGLPDGATPSHPAAAALIEPLTKAGFRVTRVVTPCNALGALARLRAPRGAGAVCWLGVNRDGVAIVVVRPGTLIYSHSFAWDSSVGAIGSQARLLQRYSLVAHLAPEVRRAMAAARQKGTTVDGIVTCGNLPDLRSLTMPLIEELDVEVETLDSLEGLRMKPALADKVSEVAPAIRLACAGAFARETRSLEEGRRRGLGAALRRAVPAIAALLALLALGGYGWRWYARRQAPPARPPAATPNRVSSPAGGIAPAPSAPRTASPGGTAPAISPGAPVAPTTAAAPPSKPARGSAGPVAPPPAAKPQPVPTTPPASAAGSTPEPGVRTHAPRGATPAAPSGTAGRGTSPVIAGAHPPDKPDAKSAGRGAAPPASELLKDPVPRVTAILVSADRRLATIGEDGRIIAVGDTIGRRVVVGIDDRTVLFREPSGMRIRVALGGRVVAVERPGR